MTAGRLFFKASYPRGIMLPPSLSESGAARPQRLFDVKRGDTGNLHRVEQEPTCGGRGRVRGRGNIEQDRERMVGIGDNKPARSQRRTVGAAPQSLA